MVCFTLIGAQSAALAAPQVKASTTYYEVTASNIQSLSDAIDRSSPVRIDGKVFHAYTETFVTWRFHWREHGKYCNLTNIQTSVQIKYTLPRLNTAAADAAVQKVWPEYLHALTAHEEGHARLAIRAAQAIEDRLKKLQPYRDYPALEAAANAVGEEQLRRMKEQEVQYDQTTNHGESQGALISLYLQGNR